MTWRPSTGYDIDMLPADGPPRPLVQTDKDEFNAAVSPDARFLAYQTGGDTGAPGEIHVRPFPNVEGGDWRVDLDGGIAPVWARDGKELFYWKLNGAVVSVIAVPITPEPTFSYGQARELSSGPYAQPSRNTQYDVHPNGRFLMMKSVGPLPRDEIVVVENWFEELKRLAPTE